MSDRKPTVGRAAKHRSRELLAYHVEMSRTAAGSPVLNFVHVGDRRTFNYRKMNAAIYHMAADLEESSDALEADRVISPEAYNSRIIIEVAEHGDEQDAWQFAKEILADR